MNIRKAQLADAEAIHALGEDVSEFSVNDETVTFWPKDLLAHAVQSDDVLVFVAEDKAAIAGFLVVNYSHGLKKALIENIYVHPDMRGQGIGDQLLQKMFDLLPDMGCEYVATLVPLDASSAISLYQRSGFIRGESFLWLDKSLSDSFKK
ncbi:MAG TPA: GNAT family N-acetyltransferase [Candidatus Saccharimonadales bacterium]|nr:GNAT family N-acetyltransferase [Candidatus Saccharimonadales bacterium]